MEEIVILSNDSGFRFTPQSINQIIFNKLEHRNEDSFVIFTHIGNSFVKLSLQKYRLLTFLVSEKLKKLGLKSGDTILLASFACSNELPNALIFSGAACLGIRVFIPIYPEPSEFENWLYLTQFSCVILPCNEIQSLKTHSKEKDTIKRFLRKCKNNRIAVYDSNSDFEIFNQVLENTFLEENSSIVIENVNPETELLVFTTSGSSGKSKLVVYTHQCFAFCAQSWQQFGLFARKQFGNPGFSPLFTHTIGIRTFINSVWAGHPCCILVSDWFIHKPEIIRYLLIQMKIGHIIAGPAFFNTMLEVLRQFPELKTEIKKTLCSSISIGAPFDQETALRFRSATGVSMMNGFGTTETLMISLNQPRENEIISAKSFGNLMPGVKLSLQKISENDEYELNIYSKFQSVRTIGEGGSSEFFSTGDIVKYNKNTGEIFFLGRKTDDFFKDEYGVKIPLPALKIYYKKIYEFSVWIEWIPMVNKPGLSALIFFPENVFKSLKELAALIKIINEELKTTLEPFEYSHRHLERIAVVKDFLPLTRKGTVSRDQIQRKYEVLISELRNPFVCNTSIEITEIGDKTDQYKFSNPHLAELLETLKIDKKFIRGKGDSLFYKEKGEIIKVTDLVGGFGSNLLGHNNDKIIKSVLRFISSGYPSINNQGSQYYFPTLLARELNKIFSSGTGKYFKVLLANSGTEATELAIHHAYFEWRKKFEKLRDEQFQLFGAISDLNVAEVWENNFALLETATPCLIAMKNCFHGYTSGSRSLLDNKKSRQYFSGLLKAETLHIDEEDPFWYATGKNYIDEKTVELVVFKYQNGEYIQQKRKFSRIIASVIEPVRGEGGISVLTDDLIHWLAEQDFPLISDEIQCGLGRTGNIPECQNADYYLLGKSLGGGVEKISAVLIDDFRFKPIFTKYYSSTFANGELAAHTALNVLQIIQKYNVPEKVRHKGDYFYKQVKNVCTKYPDIIEGVKGKGLLLGIYFNSEIKKFSNIFRILIDHELLGYFFSAWFFNRHQIRILPSLSKPNTLRIEPSYEIASTQIKHFCLALDELCRLCLEKNLIDLFSFLMNGDNYTDKVKPEFDGLFPQQLEEPKPGAVKAGFIANFTVSFRELQVIEPKFSLASDTGLRILFKRMQTLLEGKPIKILSKNLLNGRVHFTFYILPFDSAQLEVVNRWGKKRYYFQKIQEAVNLLYKENAACISLGAHTSIITGNGLHIAERESCRILTGNTLTVASCLFYLNQHLEYSLKQKLKTYTIAIVGANGNIGSGLAECLEDPKYSGYTILLEGNNLRRLKQLKDKLMKNNIQVNYSTDMFELKEADVLISCANTNDPIIFRHHINENKSVFIIDISVPKSVAEEVKKMKNVHFCEEASSVYIPGSENIIFSSHTPSGKIFCCAGESILSALYNPQIEMKGHIRKEAVYIMMELAKKEGFFNPCYHEATV